MTSFVNKVIEDIIGYINERLLGWVQHDWCSYEKGNLDTETHTGRMPCEHEDSHLNDHINLKMSQGERPGTDFPSHPSKGSNPDNTLILGFPVSISVRQ